MQDFRGIARERTLQPPSAVTDASHVGGYRLIARLGQGGTADVFLAFAEGPRGSGFAKLAVVKRLRQNLAEDPEFVSMLMDEGRVTARLSHPNVVQLFEVGRDGDDYFLAMEHLDGQPLHHIERRAAKAGKDIAPELYYAVIADVLAGLHHAHELADYDGTPLGIVHRDVTPHNVFVTYDGQVKVVDFGIAKAVGRVTETRQGIVKGKVRYMSPEQAAGWPLDRRTDVFAAGVLLYKAATGQKFWATRDEFEIPQALVDGDYDPSPRAIRPDVPEEIDAICRKALAFRAEDRYATAADMQADLERFLGTRSATARRELGTILQALFEKERANLRAVLESSAGELSASADALGLPAQPEASTMMMTVVMPNAPARPSGRTPSDAPLSIPVPRAADKASPSSKRPPGERSERKRARERRKQKSRLELRIYVGVLVASILAIVVLGTIRYRAAATSAAPIRARAELASDRLPLVHDARVLAASASPLAHVPAVRVPALRAHTTASRTPAPPPPAVEPPPAPAPATASVAAPAPAPRASKKPANPANPNLHIDNSDPWGHGGEPR